MEHIRETETRLVRGIPEDELAVCRDVMCRMLDNLAEKKQGE